METSATSPQKVIGHLQDAGNAMQIKRPTLSEFRGVDLNNIQRGLFGHSAELPDDMCLTDLQWLHEIEIHPYIPPWLPGAREGGQSVKHNILEPTIDLKFPESIPDSCPASPLILHEVPDSENES